MKRIRYCFLLFVLMLTISVSFAQNRVVNFSVYKNSEKEHFVFNSIQVSYRNLIATSFSQVPSVSKNFNMKSELESIPSAIHYEAFFCKMEIKACNRFGFQIKVRAGDDDSFREKRIIR